jgi:hypothetical protein
VTRLLLGASLCALALAGGAPAAPAISGSWVGSYRLPATADPVAITVALHGRTATVALGPGHASAQDVKVRVEGSRLRFSLPGLPADLAFNAVLRSGRLGGVASQGALRGTVQLTPGTAARVAALGLYRSTAGATVAVIQAQGLPTWLVELPDGRTHGLNAALTSVGTRLGETSGDGH